jgi:hypothetical protein
VIKSRITNIITCFDVFRMMMLRDFCSEAMVSVERTKRRARVNGWIKI